MVAVQETVSVGAAAVPVPPQVKKVAHYDFRHAATAPHGVKRVGKRKLEDYAAQVAIDEAQIAMLDEDPRPPAKKSKTQANRVSGKSWKAAAPRMSATGNPILRTSWEQKMKAKAEAALFKTQKDEARAERQEQLRSERERRKAVKLKKAANQAASLAKTGQAITNNATLRRMMANKKARKKLVQA